MDQALALCWRARTSICLVAAACAFACQLICFPCPPLPSHQIMDKHLALLAGKHLETKFVRVHAEKAPFLTGKAAWAAGLWATTSCMQTCGGRARREGALPHRRAGCGVDCREVGRCNGQTGSGLGWAVGPAVVADRCMARRHCNWHHLELSRCIILPHATCPAAADRLKVWMLPTLAIIKQEKTTDYIVGLDELGGEEFATGGFALVQVCCLRQLLRCLPLHRWAG